MVQHNNLVNFLQWEAAAFNHGPSDVFLQKTPTNFDVSIEELWTPLVTGACLVIAKPNGHKDTAYLLELINTHGVTSLSMVPSQVGVCGLFYGCTAYYSTHTAMMVFGVQFVGTWQIVVCTWIERWPH